MKGKICVVTVFVLLVLSLITASVVMAETLKYIPAPQEIPQGFYYTSIEPNSQQVLDEFQSEWGVKPIYGESAEFRKKSVTGGIFIVEFSNIEDAKECYLGIFSDLSEGPITEIDAFGDESISAYESFRDEEPFRDDDFFVALRNDKFIVLIGANDIDELNNSKIVVTDILPKMIDGKLEQIKVPTPTPTPSIPAFQIITAIATLLAVAYLLRRRK